MFWTTAEVDIDINAPDEGFLKGVIDFKIWLHRIYVLSISKLKLENKSSVL